MGGFSDGYEKQNQRAYGYAQSTQAQLKSPVHSGHLLSGVRHEGERVFLEHILRRQLPLGWAADRVRWARKPGRVGAAARRAGGSPGRVSARRVGQTRPNPGGGRGARGRRPKGAVPGAARGAVPGRRRWTLRHSTLSPAACVGSGNHPGSAGGVARRKGLSRHIRKRAGCRAFLCQIRAVLSR